MALVSVSQHLLVRSKKGAKFVPCKCTGTVTVTVVTHTTLWWKVSMTFPITVQRNRM